MGVKSIKIGAAVLVPFSFIALFVCVGHYINLNESVSGKGNAFYLGGEELPFPAPV